MPKKHMAGTMSIRLPCCFRGFTNVPSWQTGVSPFVPQASGYLKTHIIRSFSCKVTVSMKEEKIYMYKQEIHWEFR